MALRVGVGGLTFHTQDGGSILCGIQPGVLGKVDIKDAEEVKATTGEFEDVAVNDTAVIGTVDADTVTGTVVNGTTVNATTAVVGDITADSGTFTNLYCKKSVSGGLPWRVVTASYTTFNLSTGMAASLQSVHCSAKIESIDSTWYEVTLYIPYMSLIISSSQQYVSFYTIPASLNPTSNVSATATINNSTGIYCGLVYCSFANGYMYMSMKPQWKTDADNWVVGTTTIQSFVVRFVKAAYP